MWVTVNSIITTIALYSSLGIHKGLAKFMPEIRNRFGRTALAKFFKRAFMVQASLTITAVSVVWLFSDRIQEYLKLGKDSSIIILLILTATALTMFLNNLSQALASFFKQKELNLITLFVSICATTLGITLVFFGFGIKGMLAGLVTSTSLGFFFALRLLIKLIKGVNEKTGSNKEIHAVYQRMRRFSLLNYFLDIGNYFFQLPIIVFILLIFHSQKEVAIFALGFNLVMNIKNLLLVPYRTTMSPLFANIAAHDVNRIKKAHDFLTKLMIVTFIPVGLGFIALSGHIVELFYSKLFVGSVPIAQILMAAIIVEFTMTISETLFVNYEYYKSILFSRCIALLNLPLLFIVVPRYGLLGAVIVTSMTRILPKTCLFIYSFTRFEISFPVLFLQKVLLSSFAFMALIWVESKLISGHVALITISVTTSISLFLIILKTLKAFSNEDKKLIMHSAIPFKKIVLGLI